MQRHASYSHSDTLQMRRQVMQVHKSGQEWSVMQAEEQAENNIYWCVLIIQPYYCICRHGFFLEKYDDLFKLQNAIAGINYEYGDTNTADGLRLVREHYFNGRNGDRENVQNFGKEG